MYYWALQYEDFGAVEIKPLKEINTWRTGRYAGIRHSASADKKDSCIEKSYMEILRKEKMDIVRLVTRSEINNRCNLPITFRQ